MPLVPQIEQYALPPRIEAAKANQRWNGEVELDGHTALLDRVKIEGRLPNEGYTHLVLTDCELKDVSFADFESMTLELNRCSLSFCDLSGVAIALLNSVAFDSCKLIGTNLSETPFNDVRFTGGIARYLSLRMTSLTRVSFENVELSEVDLYDSAMQDVTFAGSTLNEVTLDKCRFERVDFRGTKRLDLRAVGAMAGALISEDQVIELAYQFALTSGVNIESNDLST